VVFFFGVNDGLSLPTGSTACIDTTV
jgi:hypothetical protein